MQATSDSPDVAALAAAAAPVPTSSASQPTKPAAYRPPQQSFRPPSGAGADGSFGGQGYHSSPSGGRQSGSGRLSSFGQQGGGYRPDLNRRPSGRVNGGAKSNGPNGGGGSGFLTAGMQRGGGLYYGGGGDGGYPQGMPYGGGPGWYPSSQPPVPSTLRYSPPDGSSLSQDTAFPPSALSSPAQSTATSPATSQHVSFPYNPYAPNPYAMSVSPHGYFVPPGVVYPPSGPSSSIDSSSTPSSPAPGSSSTTSSSPHTIQGHNGQTWVYVPVQIPGYYGQPGSMPYPSGPLSSSDGNFSSQGGQGPPMPMYGASPHMPYGHQQPSPPHFGQQQQQQHGPQYYAQPNQQPSPYGRGRPPPPSQFSAPNSPFLGASPAPSTQHPGPARGNGAHASPRRQGNSPAPTRKAWHPAPPAQRSEWVMWCGNVPSDATQEELWRFFTGPLSKRPLSSRTSPKAAAATVVAAVVEEAAAAESSSSADPPVPFDGECEVASIFLIARSSCCFVNYRSQEALDSAIARFNGLPMRPLEGPRSVRLVCRVRRKEDDLKAGVGGQRGRGVHKDWVKEKQVQAAASAVAHKKGEGGEEDSRASSGLTATASTPQSHRGSTISSQASTDSSFLARYFPIRYFILKSLTQVDLDTSVKTGLWATQPHNEPVLDQAFRTSKEVVLIFGANKTGEFFGYAKMAGPIKKGVSRLSWASRSSGHTYSPSTTTSALSPSSASHPTQQRSAPFSIAEGTEDDSSSPPRAATQPTAKAAPFFRSSASHTDTAIQDSPGEMLGSESAVASTQTSAATTPSLLNHVPDIDRASTPRNSAPAVLETDQRNQKETAKSAVRRASQCSDPADPPRSLTEDETAAIISEVGKASVEGTAAANSSPPSPPTISHSQPSPPHPALPPVDTDGVRRMDHAPRTNSNGELPPNVGSAGSAPSATSFTTPSSAGASSSRSFPFPNTHLPATPEADAASLPADKTAEVEASNAPAADGETWGTPFSVEWLQTQRLPFFKLKHLRNPWNQNREVKVSRDGTEIEPDVGRQLLNIWNAPAAPTETLPAAPAAPTSPSISFSYSGFSQTETLAPPDVLGLGLSTAAQSSTV